MSDNPYQSGQGAYTVSFGNGGGEAPVVIETTTASFKKDVIDESKNRPVLVDFWAPWCGPCRQLTPVLEKVVKEARGAVLLAKMNIDEHPQIPGQLGVQSIPAVFAFVNGQPVDGFMGALPESQVKEFINRVSKGKADPIGEALSAAAEAAAAGDREGALQIYGAIIAQDGENAEALAGAAGLLLDLGDAAQAETLIERVPVAKRDSEAVRAVLARMTLDKEVAGLGDPLELARRLADNPKDHDARMDLAKIENAKGERGKAADHLLAIIKADREWNEGAARAQLLQFFEAWGLGDPETLAARRKLSSILFS